VVEGDEQHMLAITQPDEPPADQRAGLQIERGVASSMASRCNSPSHCCVDVGHARAD